MNYTTDSLIIGGAILISVGFLIGWIFGVFATNEIKNKSYDGMIRIPRSDSE